MNKESCKQIHQKDCPQCGKSFECSNPFQVFCSKYCKQLDLGMWASEEYRIPGERVHLDDEFIAQQDVGS